jgi:hypothetical protein
MFQLVKKILTGEKTPLKLRFWTYFCFVFEMESCYAAEEIKALINICHINNNSL